MLIDWFTVAAQIVNFLILVWLMKRYLYQPILRAIDAREQQIASQLASAEAQRTEAEQLKREYQQKNEQIESQRASLLQTATDEAHATRHRLLEEARAAAQALAAQQLAALENESHNLSSEIAQRAQQEVLAIARKTLMQLAATNVEDCAIEVFLRRLRELDTDTKERLTEKLRDAQSPLLLHSAFELTEAQRHQISETVRQSLGPQATLAFETKASIVCGVELLANGYKVAWSIADYVDSLERGVGEIINQHAQPRQVAPASSDGPQP